MKVSKKLYEAIAAKFRDSVPPVYDHPHDHDTTHAELRARVTQWNIDLVNVADVFAAASPLFDRMRFYKACSAESDYCDTCSDTQAMAELVASRKAVQS